VLLGCDLYIKREERACFPKRMSFLVLCLFYFCNGRIQTILIFPEECISSLYFVDVSASLLPFCFLNIAFTAGVAMMILKKIFGLHLCRRQSKCMCKYSLYATSISLCIYISKKIYKEELVFATI
ncbi:hypothetical protein L9F63_019261, partial [Diploptera punctata]